jgi:predicted signal transduction protein with EAL and GGDEF domain
LDVPAVEERGPRELAVVARAFNEMVANLRAFEMQANALAAGDLDDPALETPLPGQLGVALQESVARLSHSIVEGQELRERLSREATHDALTGLPNRVAAVSALETALARSRRTGTSVGALFVDLDGSSR